LLNSSPAQQQKNSNFCVFNGNPEKFRQISSYCCNMKQFDEFLERNHNQQLNMKGVIASYIEGFFFYQLITKKAQ